MLKFKFTRPILWLNSLFILGIICMAVWRWDWIAAKLFTQQVKSVAVNIANNNSASIVATNPLKDILAANLFGNPPATVTQKQISTEKIPKSKQQLTLKGLLYYPEHPHSSAALISNADAPAKNYYVGQKLQDAEGKIYAILKDSVQIESNGKLEKLTLISLITTSDNVLDLDSPAETAVYNESDAEELEPKPDPATLLNTFGLIETAAGMNFSADKKLPAAFKITDNIVSINNYDMLDLVDYPELLVEVLAEKELTFEVNRGEETLFLTVLKTEIVNN